MEKACFKKNVIQPRTRVVRGFTVRTLQKNTKPDDPPEINFFKPRYFGPTEFLRRYNTGELPVVFSYKRAAEPGDILWKVDPRKLNFRHYLPLFCDGLSEWNAAVGILAREGACDLFTIVKDDAIESMGLCALHIKKALQTKHPQVMTNALRVIQKIATCSPKVAEHFLKYHNKILNVIALYRGYRKRFQGETDYGQREISVGHIIDETLDILDRAGGLAGYYYLKKAVPTFESVYRNH